MVRYDFWVVPYLLSSRIIPFSRTKFVWNEKNNIEGAARQKEQNSSTAGAAAAAAAMTAVVQCSWSSGGGGRKQFIVFWGRQIMLTDATKCATLLIFSSIRYLVWVGQNRKIRIYCDAILNKVDFFFELVFSCSLHWTAWDACSNRYNNAPHTVLVSEESTK